MSLDSPLIRIGTRGSPLALAQAHDVRDRLRAAHPDLRRDGAIDIRIIRTTGDTVVDRTLAAIGGKGLFTKEIEQALWAEEIDIAVHSMKDVPTILPEGLIIDCLLPREDPRDALFTRSGARLMELPPGAIIGTASLRRQAQVLASRPDLVVVPFRGNVETRLRKLADGVVDATLLAQAGLNRLKLDVRASEILEPETMLPAVAQGAVGIERRMSDARIAAWLEPLNDPATALRVTAERALLAALDGSCRTPIAALATLAGESLSLTALIVSPDGRERHTTIRCGAAADAEALGFAAGEELRSHAGADFFTLSLTEAEAR
jgi:hydroxymethylbilane synthase